MATTGLVLEEWLEKAKEARSKKELFEMLSEFQKLDWADSQRTTMSQTYMNVLDRLLEEEEKNADSESASTEETTDDGPVWYEKM